MNIYISNLSFNVQDDDLRQLFTEFGEISSAKVIMDRESGKSRGFGFVEMPNDEEGQKAIAELDQCEYDGKTINVNVAKPREDKPRTFNRGGGGGGGFRGGSNRTGGGGGNRDGGGFRKRF